MIVETAASLGALSVGIPFLLGGILSKAHDLLDDREHAPAATPGRHTLATLRKLDPQTRPTRVAELRQRIGEQPYYPQPATAQARP